MKQSLLILVLFVTVAAKTHATNVSGGIFSNTTWTKAGSPYIVTDTVVVFPGVTLTIQPGVTVEFASGKQLEVRGGKIIAVGTATDSIAFTAQSPAGFGTWGSLYVNNPNPFPAGPFFKQEFAYCSFRYATHGLQLGGNDTVNIRQSSFQYNRSGIHGNTVVGSSMCRVDSCTFSYNISGVGSFDFNNTSGNYIVAKRLTNSSFLYNQQAGAIVRSSTVVNCTFKHNAIGVWMRDQASITGCTIDSNSALGVRLQEDRWDTVSNCRIRRNAIGIQTYRTVSSPSSQRSIIRNNVIAQDSIGLMLTNNTDTIYCNSICSNSAFAIVYTNTGNFNSGIAHNNFCTPDSASTETVIYSAYDNPNVGLVRFMPLDTVCPPALDTLVTPTLAVREFAHAPVRAFPIPFTSELTLESEQAFRSATITLTNLYGQLVYQASTVSGQRFILQRGNLPAGLYFLRLSEGNVLRAMERIVITD